MITGVATGKRLTVVPRSIPTTVPRLSCSAANASVQKNAAQHDVPQSFVDGNSVEVRNSIKWDRHIPAAHSAATVNGLIANLSAARQPIYARALSIRGRVDAAQFRHGVECVLLN